MCDSGVSGPFGDFVVLGGGRVGRFFFDVLADADCGRFTAFGVQVATVGLAVEVLFEEDYEGSVVWMDFVVEVEAFVFDFYVLDVHFGVVFSGDVAEYSVLGVLRKDCEVVRDVCWVLGFLFDDEALKVFFRVTFEELGASGNFIDSLVEFFDISDFKFLQIREFCIPN